VRVAVIPSGRAKLRLQATDNAQGARKWRLSCQCVLKLPTRYVSSRKLKPRPDAQPWPRCSRRLRFLLRA